MKIRIFGFAFGRSQEIFALAKNACPDAEIRIDGLARDVSTIYAKHLGGVFSGIEKHFVSDDVRNTHRHEIINSDQPNIVISPSAMQFGGRSRKYAEYGCSQSDHLFISPGYRDPRSPEFAFFASSSHNDVFAFGAYKAPRMCKTATFNLTAHCDGDDILEMRSWVNPDKTVLVHGDKDKVTEFKNSHSGDEFVVAENDKPIRL